ncbi:MAG: glycoside hydrolase family 88 protein [Candidatus Helarchaeota archaeon]
MQDNNEKRKIYSTIHELKGWLLNSGIQGLDNDFTKGSIRIYYDIESDKYAFAYSELTGYAITSFLYINTFEQDPLLIERAKLAAEYITNLAERNIYGAIDDRFFYENQTMRPWLFSFDNGICLNGIVNLYKFTKEQKYLKIAEKIADWLISNMQRPDGSFHAAYDYKEEKIIEDSTVWSLHSEPHHAKIAIGLLNLYEITKNTKLKERAFRICDWTLKKQKDNGRFITFRLNEDTQVHPHLYAAEALLYAGIKYHNSRYIKSSQRATDWVLSLQFDNGAFPRQFKDGRVSNEESVYELIQTIRLWLLHGQLVNCNFNHGDLKKAVKRLLEYQCRVGNQKMKYGLFFQMKGDKTTLPHINGGAPLAAIQTLIIYYKKILNDFDFDLNLFV